MAKHSPAGPRSLFGLLIRLSPEERTEARRLIDDSGGPSARFWILLLLSTVIAGFGLLANSAAVIIGAMIIAPLMGPILASALAIDAGDNRLLVKALIAEVLGVAAAVSLAVLIGMLPINLGITPEMLARANPTLYDLFIATASGLAGAYATVDSKISSALAGVAISVALVPPVACCGLFLSLGSYQNAWGAFLLFLANFLAIQVAAGFVFFVYRIADIHDLKGGITVSRIWRFGPSLLLLIAIGTFLTSTLLSLARDRTLEAGITRVLSREVGARTGGQLDQVIRRGETKDGYEVIAVALTPQPFDPAQVAMMQAALREEVRPDIKLIVRSLASSDADSTGQVFLTDAEITAVHQQKEEETTLARATDIVNRHLSDVPGARLVNLLRTQSDGTPAFTAVVRTPTAITPSQVSAIQDSLATELHSKAKLNVRSILTRDADSTRYLYEPVNEVKPLSVEELAVRARIRSVLENRIRSIDGAVLKEVNIEQAGTRRLVLAIVEAPKLVEPPQVAQYEKDLRTYIDPGIALTVRTTISGLATGSGWSRTQLSPSGSIQPQP